METKDRTQASYTLVDINEQTRIDFEKCKETKEQKIERLKKKLKQYKILEEENFKERVKVLRKIKQLEQQLKELEDDEKGKNEK